MLLRKLLFTFATLSTLMLSPVLAQDGQITPARDVRVVVDISGSMKLNDPRNLRQPAVRLLAGLLPDETGVGLWTFGRQVNMLVPHAALDDTQRDALIDGSGKINSVAQRTNIGDAIEEASDDWYAPDRALENTHLILLSDGKVDIAPSTARNDQERDRILGELVPRLASRGLTIHTIALSAEADLDLLGAIADRTGGVAHVAETAEELSRIFADTLGQAVPANEVPLDDNRFAVDEGVEEFTALIFSNKSAAKRELTLISPDGQRYSAAEASEGLRWAREPGYDLITVEQPAAGEWQLEGDAGEGSRVTVVSDLRLEVTPLPARFRPDEQVDVEAFFTEDGERLTGADFLRVIEVRLSMTTGDGRRGTRTLSAEQPPEDGIYRDTISQLRQPGQYQLELEADGGTFSRKFRQTLTLVSPEGQPEGAPAEEPDMPLIEESTELPVEGGGPDTAADGPIDVSQVEPQPQPEHAADGDPETAPAQPSLVSWWPWAVAAAAGLGIALAVLLVLRRQRGDPAPDGETGPEQQATPGPAGTGPEQESPQPAPASDEAVAPELTDKTTGEPGADVLPDDRGSPGPGEKADAGPGAEPMPESLADADAAEPRREDDPGLDGYENSLMDSRDGDEFGLDDFDLSDIDDLPDLEADDESSPPRPPADSGDDNKT